MGRGQAPTYRRDPAERVRRGGYLRSMVARAMDVLFPRRCAGCGAGPWPFCDACRAQLIPLEAPWCERCGRPWPAPAESCRDCPPQPITTARAPFAFHGPARRAIHRLKFSGWRGVAAALAAAMTTSPSASVDLVTWVPLASRRLAERGYDQARLLAEPAARALDLPCRSLLRRSLAGGPQARRDGTGRRTALRGAFIPKATDVPARVLLVDDVLTTGATAASCAETLTRMGAREVHVLTASRSFSGAAYTRAGPCPGLWLPGGVPR
jgi:competence protein ComFC